MSSRSALIVVALVATSAVAVESGFIWIEGEDADSTNITFQHDWYAGQVKKDQLSGGDFIANFSDQAGQAEYRFAVPWAASYEFWVRASPVVIQFSYQLDGGPWAPIDMNRNQRGNLNIAQDGGVDIRYITWAKVGTLQLAAGSHTLTFKFHGGQNNHGSLDCFVLSRAPFEPQGKTKPGEKTGLADPGMWAFEPAPDTFSDQALFDLRHLNEEVAGQSGFLRLSEDGNDFVLGDGTPVKFWAINTSVYNQADLKGLTRHGRFLAKRGVNMVRSHVQVSVQRAGSKITDVNRQVIDNIWKHVAAMKVSGIYTTISPYWGVAQKKVPASWGIEGWPEDQNALGLLFFNEKLQEGYKAWLRALYAPNNPYTGIPLARDPAVGVIQIQNEDSLLFWTLSHIKGAQLDLLGRKFGVFLAGKYGSLEKANAAWGGAGLPEDDFGRGYAHIEHIWRLTQNQTGAAAKRLADQLQFLSETMYKFNAEVERFLREELGCRHLVNAGNWRTADQIKLLDAERWSYTANQVIASNRYYGGVHTNPRGRAGYMVEAGDHYTDPSALLNVRQLPTNNRFVVGAPFIITESTWTAPMSYLAEGPFLIAAYGALTGLDGYYWFATRAPEYALPGQKFPLANPAILGNFPAAALMYRQGYIRQGRAVVHEERRLQDMWDRKSPLLAEDPGFDPNRDAGDIAPLSSVQQGVDPLAYLVGPVEVKYGGDPARSSVMDLSDYIHQDKQFVRSVTGELSLDYGRGFCTLNAPKAQGVTGFLKREGVFDLADVRIQSGNDYASILVVSLDEKPLKISRKILVQVGTICRPYGFRARPARFKGSKGEQTFAGFQIEDLGMPPWNVANADITLTINNRNLRNALLLDSNAMPVNEVPVLARKGALTVTLPPDTLYLVLQ